MRLMLIDTCGAQGSVAIADTGCAPLLVKKATLPGRSASERLVAEARGLAAGSRIALASLDAIAVVNGPGSFTGVRVGLSAAKGLCEALSIPLIAISRLAVLTFHAKAPQGERVRAVLDAGRGEFYCGEYLDGLCTGEALMSRDELMELARPDMGKHRIAVCEDGVFTALGELRPQMVDEPDAAAAIPLAVMRGEAGRFDDVATVDANYLRRTDKEIFVKMQARASAATGSGK
ncbi:MAG TPA: tRNA (adenosine(37)-N6)-threonylcarbamoyltransferase complex dimerization subunit type 1 TsaB [Acidobacteriaceae bacterium]|nr:tRNA (adenosine(37)-N6)-threonylcarbamoyltransferase complex dimerization subunit type 1 TsaB [Acidobacteriaceae bacterium]